MAQKDPIQDGGSTGNDDVDVIEDYEELIKQSPLVRVFGDSPRVRILSVLLDAYPRPLNVSSICDRAAISRTTWYNHVEDLQELELIVETGESGISMYSVPEPEDDPRYEALEILRDASAAELRQG